MSREYLLPPFIISSTVFIIIFYSLFQLSTIKVYNSTPIIEDSMGSFLSQGSSSNAGYGYWPMDNYLDSRVAMSLISVEDKRFYKHNGVDFKALVRALKENLLNKNPQGGSTLAMQVIRIQENSRRNLLTKLFETSAAYLMTIRYGRNSVLNHYMTITPLGMEIHGFSYGARRFFKKPIEDLSWAESAILVSLPKSPSKFNLTGYTGMMMAKNRANLVLKRLVDQKIISESVYKHELETLNSIKAISLEKRPSNSLHYMFRATREITDSGIKSGVVNTTLNSDLQNYIKGYIDSIYGELLSKDANNISVIVSDKSGEVLSYIGSQNYYNSNAGGSINFANRRRSSGSTLKPFLYLKSLDDGVFTPASIIDDLPIQIVSEDGSFIAANYDEDFLGPMLFRKTLANSRNIPSVRILEETGLSSTYNYFQKLNFVHRDLSPTYYGYGMILGGLYVTLEDLVKAYGSLQNSGGEFDLKWYKGDLGGNPVSVGSNYNSRLISDFLSDPIARLPSFKRLGGLEYSYPVAIKTGTSQGYRDAWAVAYSADYIVGIWIGRDDNGGMNHLSGSVAANYLKEIMNYLHPDQVKGLNQKPFKKPTGSIPVEICTISGKLKGPNCDDSITEYFKEGEVPIDICDVHIQLAIDKRSGSLASYNTPSQFIATENYLNLPTKYSVWIDKNGIKTPVIGIEDYNSSSENIPETKLVVTSPVDNARYLIDLELPLRYQTIPLIVDTNVTTGSVSWYVNDSLLESVEYPYQTRFNLSKGEHEIVAEYGGLKSAPVHITVE